MTHSKDHGAPCPHIKFDLEKRADQTKHIVVISKVDVGSAMYKQGIRWTQYFDFDGRQNAVTNMVPFFFKMINVIYIARRPFSTIRRNFYVNNCSFLYIIKRYRCWVKQQWKTQKTPVQVFTPLIR